MIDRCLPFRTRADVWAVRVDYSDQATWVLKDPVTLELYHLMAEEYFLFEQLRQPTSLGQLQRRFEQTFPPRRVSIDVLQTYLNGLFQDGLLLNAEPGQGRELLARSARRRRQWWLSSASRLLAIPLPGIDATRLFHGSLLARLKPARHWFFSRGMLLLICLLGLWAIATLVGHWDEWVAEIPTLSGLLEPRTLLALALAVVIVKLLHEFAHAVVCLQLGGQVREIGVMLLAGMPVLYCDVSDVWNFPNKWHRLAVSAAGMGIELLLAAMAILVWSATEPGILHAGCLKIILVCGVGTLLVNANPLLRYDGYYMLADWLEVPNLSLRGRAWLARALRDWLLGETAAGDPMLGPAKDRLVAAYAIGSRLYLTLVLAGLFLLFRALARPYHLENLVTTLAVFLLAGYLLSLGVAWGMWWLNPSVRRRIRPRRLVLLGLVAAGLMTLVLAWPIQRQVTAPVVLVPATNAPLYATEGGMLVMALPSGTQVEAGDVVARLTDPWLEQELAQVAAGRDVARLRREQLQVLRVLDARVASQFPAVEATLASTQAQLEQQRQRAERLELVAPHAGRVLTPPPVDRAISGPEPTFAGQLPGWSGTLLEPDNVGAWVEPGTLVAVVADSECLEAWVAVAEEDVPQVVSGQSVRLALESLPGQVLAGEVELVARRATHPAHPVSAGVGPRGRETSYHLVRVRLPSQESRLWIGMRGRAKIETHVTTLAATLSRHLRATFRLPW